MKSYIAITLSWLLIFNSIGIGADVPDRVHTKITEIGRSTARSLALADGQPSANAAQSLRNFAREWTAFQGVTRATALRGRATSNTQTFDTASAQDLSTRFSAIRSSSRTYFAGLAAELRRLRLESKLPLLYETQQHVESALSQGLIASSQEDAYSKSAETINKLLLGGSTDNLPNQSSDVPGGIAQRIKTSSPVASEGSRFIRTNRPAAINPRADSPTSGDLAESQFVQLSPAIRTLAGQLGKSPAKIYAYVRNRTTLLTHYGLMQDSRGVLASSSGNPAEQATLLIALMRAAGIPARYASGTATVRSDDAQRWTGTLNAQAAASVIGQFAISAEKGAVISFTQYWVQAWVDQGNGPGWVDLDTSFKFLDVRPGVSIAAPAFDRLAYLQNQAAHPASEVYTDSIKAAVVAKYPGKGVSDAAVTMSIVQDLSGVLPGRLPYSLSGVPVSGNSLDQLFSYRVHIAASEAASSVPVLDYDLVVPTVAPQSIVLSWTPASPADAQIIQLWGGLNNAPAFLIHLKPQLLLDGAPVQTGSGIMTPGTLLNVGVTVIRPGSTTAGSLAKHQVQLGANLSLCLNANQISESFLESRLDAYLAAIATRTVSANDSLAGEMLSIAGWRYFSRVAAEYQRVAAPLQLAVWLNGPSEGAAIGGLRETDLFDKPLLITPSSTLIDIKGASQAIYALDGSPPSAFADVARVAGMTSSSLEHEIWEELVFTPSMSTVKGLALAYKNKIPVLTITKSNAAAAIASLTNSTPSLVQDLQTAIAGGYDLLINQSPIQLNSWKGFVWIQENPNGSFAYNLLGGTGGGASTADPEGTQAPPRLGGDGDPSASGGWACGQPVTLSNGNMFHRFTDLRVADPFLPLELTRTYNSQTLHSGPLGYGWTHNYNLKLREASEGVYFTDATGASSLFPRSGSVFSRPEYLYLQLTKDTQGYTLQSKDGIVYRFDSAGLWQSVTDRNGNVERLTYDSGGKLTSVSAPSGRRMVLAYNSTGQILTISDGLGRIVRYAYDSDGNLISSTDPLQNQTKYVYLKQPGLRSLQLITYPERDSIQFGYYPNRKIAKTIDRYGSEMRFYYLPLQNQTMLIDYHGLTTIYEYNQLGNIVKVITPDANTITRQVNVAGQVIGETNELGFTTLTDYDSLGNVTAITDALGNKRQFTWDPTYNQLATSTDALGKTTTFSRDGKGNLILKTDPLGNTTGFSYDTSGKLVATTDGENNATTTVWAGPDPIKVITALGNATTLNYDLNGRLTGSNDPLGNQTSLVRDLNDQVTSRTDALNLTSSLTYDGNGHLTQTKDPVGRINRYTYDGGGRLNSSRDPLGASSTLGYSDATCACTAPTRSATSYTDPNGGTWKFSFDYRGLQTSSTDPLGNITRLDYDAAGRLVRSNAPDGTWITYQYDRAGRLLTRTQSTGQADQFSYTANGDIGVMGNQAVRVTNTYDAARQLVSVADSRLGAPLSYRHDHAGRVTNITTPAGSALTYSYDKESHLARIVGSNGQSASIAYDASGRRSQITFSNGTSASYSYDSTDRITSVQHIDSKGQKIAAFGYVYDRAGNRILTTDSSGTHKYTYDDSDRLIGALHPDRNSESFAYDAAHNRVSSDGDTYSYDAANQLLKAGSIQYWYDRRGNVTKVVNSGSVIDLEYDSANNVVSIKKDNELLARYAYDPIGRRVAKRANNLDTTYLYDGVNLLQTAGVDGVSTYATGRLDDLLFIATERQALFAHQDGLQSVVALSGASGSIVSAWHYSTFGRPNADDPTAFTAFRFNGREFDNESGYYYYRARVLDPTIGRFLQRDILQDVRDARDFARYSFVRNNPLRYLDPTGLSADGSTSAPCLPAVPVEPKDSQLLGAMATGAEMVDAAKNLKDASDTARYMQNPQGLPPQLGNPYLDYLLSAMVNLKMAYKVRSKYDKAMKDFEAADNNGHPPGQGPCLQP